MLSSWQDKTVRLWDVATGKEVKRFIGHTDEVNVVAFSPDDTQIVTGGKDNTSRLWNIQSGKELKRVEGRSPLLSYLSAKTLTISKDGRYLAACVSSCDLWELDTGKHIRKLNNHFRSSVTSLAFSDDGRYLIVGGEGFADGPVVLLDVASGNLVRQFVGHTANVTSVDFLAGEKYAITSSIDSTARIWNIQTGQELCRLTFLASGAWVCTSPDGRFDSNDLDNIRGIHWRVFDEPLKPYSPEIFMRDYFEPGLLKRLLEGEVIKPVRNLQSLNRTQPKLSELKVSALDADGFATITFDIANQVSEKQHDLGGKLFESGVYDVRLFRDGQLVGYTTKDQNEIPAMIDTTDEKALGAWHKANEVKLDNSKKSLSFRVAMPQVVGKQSVEFSAYAFNADRVKSETVRTEYKLPTTLTAKPKRAYVVTFGVNINDNPKWKLNYAANDARLVANELTAKLQASGEYVQVISVPLLSDNLLVNGQSLQKRDATKANLKATIDLLAGRTPISNTLTSIQLSQLKKVTPNDLVIFAFASHGYTDNNGIFYLLPQDTGKITNDGLLSVLNRCVSSDELSQWLRDVDAGEMVMIVDACHSAAAVQGQGFKPGPMGSRGLGQLAYDKRMRILAATQADNVALEMSKLEHGLLTYALLEDGLRQKQADYKPKDAKIELGEWLRYGMDRVPKLYEEYQAGKRTVLISGRTSKLAGNINQKVTSIQQPTLFDFAKKRDEIILVK